MDKREQILTATAQLIAEQGLQDSPMATIAKNAGCGAGTIYRYFETKEDLVQELYADLWQKLECQCLGRLPETEDLREHFNCFWGNFYNFLIENPTEMALLEQLRSSPAIHQEIREKSMKKMRTQIEILLAHGRELGIIKPVDDDLLMTITFGSLMNIASQQLNGTGLCVVSVSLPEMLDICWDAICVHK